MKASGHLIAVDGISGAAVIRTARTVLKAAPGRPGGISRWDASGLFDQLVVAGNGAGVPSARTLLLLYAADLAFRLRWEIEPMLADGKTVVAAPYVATAIAFGRASGLKSGWLTNLFAFAPVPGIRHSVSTSPRSTGRNEGFIEFASRQIAGHALGMTRPKLLERARMRLMDAAATARAADRGDTLERLRAAR